MYIIGCKEYFITGSVDEFETFEKIKFKIILDTHDEPSFKDECNIKIMNNNYPTNLSSIEEVLLLEPNTYINKNPENNFQPLRIILNSDYYTIQNDNDTTIINRIYNKFTIISQWIEKVILLQRNNRKGFLPKCKSIQDMKGGVFKLYCEALNNSWNKCGFVNIDEKYFTSFYECKPDCNIKHNFQIVDNRDMTLFLLNDPLDGTCDLLRDTTLMVITGNYLILYLFLKRIMNYNFNLFIFILDPCFYSEGGRPEAASIIICNSKKSLILGLLIH